uniref:Uncharacterized protein n=1 Tax=Setaria italica TaxID=4555 RepID=K3ZB77_SETIT
MACCRRSGEGACAAHLPAGGGISTPPLRELGSDLLGTGKGGGMRPPVDRHPWLPAMEHLDELGGDWHCQMAILRRLTEHVYEMVSFADWI